MGYEVLTVGHSTHSYERFLTLLRDAGVTAIADVRSSPYSRHFPHFNRNTLQSELKSDRIAYVFLGEELGGRPKNKSYYSNGVADYEKMSCDSAFLEGIQRIANGMSKHRIALMCSEHNPLDCHRCLLVGRELKSHNVTVQHILSSGKLMTQMQVEADLLRQLRAAEADMFMPPAEQLANAYRTRAQRVAFAYDKTINQVAAE